MADNRRDKRITAATARLLLEAFYGRDGWRVRRRTAQMDRLDLVHPLTTSLTPKGMRIRSDLLVRQSKGEI